MQEINCHYWLKTSLPFLFSSFSSSSVTREHEPTFVQWHTYRKQETNCVTTVSTVEWFIDFVIVYWCGHKGITLPGNDVAVEKSKAKTCRFVESKNIVTVANCRPFSVSFCRLSVNQKGIVATFLSNAACLQNPLEGLFRRVVLPSVSHSLAPFSWPNQLAETLI